jgi:hypothetical protein
MRLVIAASGLILAVNKLAGPNDALIVALGVTIVPMVRYLLIAMQRPVKSGQSENAWQLSPSRSTRPQ